MNRFDSMMKHAGAWVNRHSAQILIGIGIGSSFTTTVLAVIATPKAMERIEEKKREIQTDELTPMETVQACWKCYIPSAVTGTMSVICLVGSSAVSEKRNAALAAAYGLSEAARINYRDKVIEVIGEKKEKEVRDAVAKDQMLKNPVKDSEVILTNRGSTLCYDALSGRYFRSNKEALKRAENEINEKMLNEMYVSLNDFYDLIGLSHNDIGDDIGWNTDKGMIHLYFTSQMMPDDSIADVCMAVTFDVMPFYDFNRLY